MRLNLFFRTGKATTGKTAIILAALAAGLALTAAPASAQNFQTAAPHAILIDADSGAVLFEKAADEPFSPASMAKLMTTELVFGALKEGRLTMDSEFTVTEDAWRRGGAGGGGSSMFAQLNSRIKLSDMLRGLIVQSGNDAAITIAENMAGTEEAFANLMNAKAKEIGLTRSVFRNATGYSAPDQKVTARDMARIATHLIDTYPDLYKIFAEREFTWNKIKQQNRNPLLTLEIGADGLKTGYLEESGYALTGSAVQNGQRLVMVVSGLKTARDRATETRKLMEWGFRAFEPRQVFAVGETVAEVSVFGGEKGSVPVVAKKPVRLLLPRGSTDRVSAKVIYQGPLTAPVEQGREIGRLRIMRGEAVALDQPLYAGESVGTGTIPQRALDAALEVGAGLFHKAMDKAKGTGGGNSSLAGGASRGRPAVVSPHGMTQDAPKGVFITFEGGEGAGKSTQIARLAARLRTEPGREVVTTREPGGTPRAEEIREALLSGAAKPYGAFAEALLFCAARIDHLDRLIRPALARGAVVLCDRFCDSTRAYQGAAGGLDADILRALERVTLGGTRPDLTLILDLLPETGLARARARAEQGQERGQGADRFEAEALSFHIRLREAFRVIAQAEPGRCAIVDAEPEPDIVEAAIRETVAAHLPTLLTPTSGHDKARDDAA